MGMNSQIHLTIDTDDLNRLRYEAEELEISVAELIRRKLSNPPTEKEIVEEIQNLTTILFNKIQPKAKLLKANTISLVQKK